MCNFTGVAFVHPEDLTEKQTSDMRLGMNVMAAFWKAAHELDADRPHLLPHSRCIYSSCAIVDILHAIGRTEATCFRSGLDLRMARGGKVERMRTIGHPAAELTPSLWNAHLTVQLGELLFDPTHAQMRRSWNDVPHYAAFKRTHLQGSMIDFRDARPELCLSEHVWREGDRMYKTTFFKLAREVDLRTRRWRSAPDARPERRTAVIDRTLELVENAEEYNAVRSD